MDPMSLTPPTPPPIITPNETNTITLKRPDAPKDSKADTPRDREERAIASLLSRFKNLVSLAATKIEDGATKEVAAAHSFQMETESAALVRAAEDLLQLTRELKEMWLFGPLRGIGEGEGEGTIDEDSKTVGEMVERMLKKENEGEAS